MHVPLQALTVFLGASSMATSAPTEASANDLMLDLNRQAINALEDASTQFSERSTPKKCTIANAACNFLTWHRYYTWAYEKALQGECGYKGTQPYWNWFETRDFISYPLFDGLDTSVSGNGEYFKHNGSFSGRGTIHVPSGNGGGCIRSGPFAGAVANLGPPAPSMDGMIATKTPLECNSRCLRRDLSRYAMEQWIIYPNLHNLTLGVASSNIDIMQKEFQGGRFAEGFLGLHGAGHYGVGGNNSDLYSSPNDPNFFLHHSMANIITGAIIVSNNPPSRDALKTDSLNMGINVRDITIGDALNNLGGSPFCYISL
ncbi:hypothetical protein FSHL1_012814 [Fusarium sambucinum]